MCAAHYFSHEVELNLTGPKTVVQYQAPTNQRVRLLGVEVMPLGSTGASVPLEFDVQIQTTAGAGGTDDSANLVSDLPVPSETIQTGVLIGSFSAEPTGGDSVESFSLHQQGARQWQPLKGPIIIPGGSRLALRFLSTSPLNTKYRIHLEE